ncbi:hypothetical protein HZZ16_26040 [Bradyrhizobium sp. CNPSo 4016]|nr:hypothetical protein [Bradyrhizobium glycinis]
MVRVGVTQYPAGLGVTDTAELKPDLVDPLIPVLTSVWTPRAVGQGSSHRYEMVWRASRGGIGGAVGGWKTGYFDGNYVFDEADPWQFAIQQGAWDAGDRLADDDAAKPADLAPSFIQGHWICPVGRW